MTALKIEPPALPLATEQYQRPYQDQLNNVQRLFYNRLTQSHNVILGVNGVVNLQAPHALLMSDQTQPNAGVTSTNLVTYNVPAIAQGIEVRNGHELWFSHAGQYLITFSLQFTNRGNAAQTLEVWAKNGADNYPLSNTRFDIAARKSTTVWAHTVAAVSGIFTVTDPDTSYLALAWWSDGADVFLEHYPEGVNPPRPAIPSVILTASFVSRLP